MSFHAIQAWFEVVIMGSYNVTNFLGIAIFIQFCVDGPNYIWCSSFVGCFSYISEFEMTRNAEKLFGHVVTTPTICCNPKEKNNSGLRCNLCFGIVEVEICDLCDLDLNRRYRPSISAKHSLLCCCSDNVITPSTNLTFLFTSMQLLWMFCRWSLLCGAMCMSRLLQQAYSWRYCPCNSQTDRIKKPSCFCS